MSDGGVFRSPLDCEMAQWKDHQSLHEGHEVWPAGLADHLKWWAWVLLFGDEAVVAGLALWKWLT